MTSGLLKESQNEWLTAAKELWSSLRSIAVLAGQLSTPFFLLFYLCLWNFSHACQFHWSIFSLAIYWENEIKIMSSFQVWTMYMSSYRKRYSKANSGWPTLRDGLIGHVDKQVSVGRLGKPASNICETTQNAPAQSALCSYVLESSPLKLVYFV